MMNNRTTGRISSVLVASAGGLAAMMSPAMAHHPMGGAMPSTFTQGLLSGIGHPVIGFDHLAFIIGVGIAAAFLKMRYMLPLAFIGATIAGCLLTAVMGVTLPFREVVIAASVALIGVLVMSGKSMEPKLLGGLFAMAGLFHGAAYAGAVIGAEATPIVSYLIGFSLIQFAIAAGAGWMAREFTKATSSLAMEPRLAGAIVMGVGATFLIEHAEKLAFSGL
jgi:urease accessory protein